MVESTADDYFVLYVRDDTDAALEQPVSLALGKAGTTTLAERLAALPKERYRVEKYRIADPADIDGDCIDDITELEDPVGMSPITLLPHRVQRRRRGHPRPAAFEALSYRRDETPEDFEYLNLSCLTWTATDRAPIS